ncbi:MBL fold metallo-hydrolase [Calidifontibacter terrae]
MTNVVAAQGNTRIERVVTSGTFSLDGGTWDVDNNVWIIGDDTECVVVDAAHDAAAILAAVGERKLVAVLLTHAHDDHIDAAGDLVAATAAPTHLHPADRELWNRVYSAAPDKELSDGQQIPVAGVTVEVLHTPGHCQGACSFRVADLGVVLTGDTLFQGGPGATGGRSFSDYDQITDSIRTKLFAYPPETVVLTGHGDNTTIGAEIEREPQWERPAGA